MDIRFVIELLKTAFIGLVEGVTEWLPVSSTGHMILVDEFVKLDVSEEFWNMFLVVVQLGAILAACLVFFSRLNPWSRGKTPAERRETWGTWGKIVVGVAPAAVVGIPLDDFMEERLSNAWVVAAALIVYGVAFIAIERWRARRASAAVSRGAHFAAVLPDDDGIRDMSELSFGKAFGIGCFQVLSLVPGTSRSGSTIIGGLLLGASRTLAAEFSFFMAIPVMFGASALRLAKYLLQGGAFTSYELAVLGVGMAVAFATSVFTIKFLLRFIKTNDFQPFGWYRIALGVVVVAYFAARSLM